MCVLGVAPNDEPLELRLAVGQGHPGEAMRSRRPSGKLPSVNGNPAGGGEGLLTIVDAPPSVTVAVCEALMLVMLVIRPLVPILTSRHRRFQSLWTKLRLRSGTSLS